MEPKVQLDGLPSSAFQSDGESRDDESGEVAHPLSLPEAPQSLSIQGEIANRNVGKSPRSSGESYGLCKGYGPSAKTSSKM
jgi:hypothetical protein